MLKNVILELLEDKNFQNLSPTSKAKEISDAITKKYIIIQSPEAL